MRASPIIRQHHCPIWAGANSIDHYNESESLWASSGRSLRNRKPPIRTSFLTLSAANSFRTITREVFAEMGLEVQLRLRPRVLNIH